MNTTDVPATRPDISALDVDVQLRIEVHEVLYDGRWEDNGPPHGWWLHDGVGMPAAIIQGVGDVAPTWTLYDLPDYPADPAAWGALMEREMHGWDVTGVDHHLHRCLWRKPDAYPPVLLAGPWAETIGRAVCPAVLAKDGRDISRYTEGEARWARSLSTP